ncbi:uncharacterized protein LOC130732308 [Lotus japonicus]|uniref:uncharacterized LOC130732308 n=1 Tax=Lotus japonicus TaxID=34305 RepID=UPI002586590A|nr:uncharacterized LOC130732308 [Lotus japonicus]
MEAFEHHQPELKLPPEWFHDPLAKCYSNLDTLDTFCYSEELFCFVDSPPPNPLLLKNVDDTNTVKVDNSPETEEPSDAVAKETPALETAPAPEKAEVPVSKERRKTRCGFCGEEGHNRRSCSLET